MPTGGRGSSKPLLPACTCCCLGPSAPQAHTDLQNLLCGLSTHRQLPLCRQTPYPLKLGTEMPLGSYIHVLLLPAESQPMSLSDTTLIPSWKTILRSYPSSRGRLEAEPGELCFANCWVSLLALTRISSSSQSQRKVSPESRREVAGCECVVFGRRGGGWGGGVGLSGLSEALSSEAYGRAVFKAGPGRGGSHKEEMKGPASKPRGKGSGTGTGGCGQQAALATPQPTAAVQLGGRGLCRVVSTKRTGVTSPTRIRAKAPAGPTAAVGAGWSAWGLGRRQLSDSSDSWGGKESHSPGSGSPRWCLQGPPGPSAGPW